ncbi:MAG TPA: protein kinase [Terriglobales bacterium]|nr:protein kinase [Terriglobales bacterium]
MALTAGTKLGPYEIQSPLGAGGMGEVYRARDTRLDRSVAIKILPSHLSCSAELKNRFEREARTLSSISHPHICHLYDVGSQDGVEFLVMELVNGETLADRLQKGRLPIQEVLKIGIEIAEALAKAHRLGIIHRDLKPANVMLTREGVKLMDFGLAKPAAMGVASGSPTSGALTQTLQSPATPISVVGTVVGTIQYMSPEQIEGKDADARSDIFALGAVLYEMATGQRAFQGSSHLSVASAILQKEPTPLCTAQPSAPPGLDYVIRTCLAKDPDERFQTAHDVKLQLSWLSQGGGSASAVAEPRPATSKRLPLFGVALLAVAVVAVAFLMRVSNGTSRTNSYGPVRFSIAVPPGQDLATDNTAAITVSPDGKHLAYIASVSGVSHLYVRRLDQFQSVEIPNSESPTFPFFMANGEWVAFFSQGKLQKAPADGGDPVLIAELPTFFGGTWMPPDTLVVAIPSLGLATMPASGGVPQKITIDTKERFYPQGPAWIPGTDWVVFTDYFGSGRRVLAVDLKTGEMKTLVRNAEGPFFAAGHLVYFSGGAVWAAAFDASKIVISGDPVKLASEVNEENYVAQEAASSNGLLAYAPGPAADFSRYIYFVNRSGVEQKADVPAQDYVDPRFSPDGRRVALSNRRISEQQIVVYDRDRGVLTSIVSNGGLNGAPVWTPDGKDLVFDAIGLSMARAIFRAAADGSSPPQLLHENPVTTHVTDIAGDQAVVMVNDPNTSTDLWLLTLSGNHEMRPFRQTPAAERQGTFAPNGTWLAYASNESGHSEIYVEPVPGPGGRLQISNSGGEQPRWARNGREIFYRSGTKMMSVPVEFQPEFRAGKPVELFDRKFDRGGTVGGYDVSPDAQTFVMTRSEHANPTEIRIVLDALDTLPTK